MDTSNNSQSTPTGNSYSFSTKKYWCFLCEKEFSHLYSGPAEVFCPVCSGISELIDSEDDPRGFKAYDPQREGANANSAQNTGNLLNNNPPQGQSMPQNGNNIQGTNGTYSVQQITIPNLFGEPRVQNIHVVNFGSISSPQQGQQGTQNPQQNIPNPLGDLFANNPFLSMMSSMASGLFRTNIFEEFDSALIEQFLRNDPNNHGPPPASQETIAKLQEIKYCSENCIVKDCTICQEEYKEGDNLLLLPCEHNFHRPCVSEWLSRHNSCPVCRKELKEEVKTEEHQQAPEGRRRVNSL